MFFDENAARRMHEQNRKAEEKAGEKAKDAQAALLFGVYVDGAVIIEGNPPLITVKTEPGDTFTPGSLYRFERKRGWILLGEVKNE